MFFTNLTIIVDFSFLLMET